MLQMGILPGIFFFILIFLSLEDKEAAPEALEFSFQHYMEGVVLNVRQQVLVTGSQGP